MTAEFTAVGDLFELVIGTVRWPIVIIIGIVSAIYTAYGGLYVSIVTDQVLRAYTPKLATPLPYRPPASAAGLGSRIIIPDFVGVLCSTGAGGVCHQHHRDPGHLGGSHLQGAAAQADAQLSGSHIHRQPPLHQMHVL